MELQLELAALVEGTPRQIAWAEDIRRNKVRAIISEVEEYLSTLRPAYRLSFWEHFAETSGNPIARIDSAIFWIDCRFLPVSAIFPQWLFTLDRGTGNYRRGPRGGRGRSV